MLHRATWRAHRGDPRNWPGWFARDAVAPALWIAQRLEKLLLLLCLVGLVLREWPLAFMGLILATVPEQVVTAVASMWGGRFVRSALRFVTRPLPVDDLVAIPPPAPPFPCRIEAQKAGTVLGTDIGVVTFLDGWLHYEGHRTSFSLQRCAVAERRSERVKLAGGGAIAFAPHDWIGVDDLVEFDLKNRFEANLKSWMRSDSPVGESILPPDSFHTSGVVRAWSNLATAAVSILPMAAALVWVAGPRWAAFFILPFLFGLARSLRDVVRVCRAARTPSPVPAVE